MSCSKPSCVFRSPVTTTMDRSGKSSRSKTAKNGWADWATPVQGNTPPFSRRCARDCTAGACLTRANNSLVAVIGESCAKRGQGRRGQDRRQVRQIAVGRTVARLKLLSRLTRQRDVQPESRPLVGRVFKLAQRNQLFL